MALFTGLTSPVKLGGVFGMSCYMLLMDKLKALSEEAGQANLQTMFWMGHGEEDPLVQFNWGLATADKIRDWGYDVEFKGYP